MRHLSLIAGALLLAVALHAQEKVTLVDPVHTDPGATEFRLMALNLNAGTREIHVTLAEVASGSFSFKPDGKTLLCDYYGDDAESLLTTLNTMNFSTVSLQKRVIQVCVKDKKIPPGTVSGTPSTFTPTRIVPPPIIKRQP
jgi:hypothetical protein